MRHPCRDVVDADLRQAVFAFGQHEVIREYPEIVNRHIVALGHNLLPIFAVRVGDRRGYNAEVTPLVVRADVEKILPIIIDVVLKIFLAWRDNLQRFVEMIGAEITDLIRGFAADREIDKPLAA